jgi:CBS-domain-containing membrane protein
MSMLQEDRRLSDISIADLMISSEKVAHVQVNNPLEHALLVLVKSGYSAVPVLDTSFKLVGIVSKTTILNQILGMERFEIEKLSELKVKDVLNDNLLTLKKENNILDGLNATIDHAFVCVVDKDDYFDGILTRRAILKQLKKEIYMTKLFNK